MHTWFTILRLRWITIRAHYTWLLLLPIGVWMFAQAVLPSRLPAGSSTWPVAIALGVIYVACVVIHEAGHLGAARLLRFPMPALNLHPIGVLVRRGREDSEPGRTFMVAAAGPAANLVAWFVLATIQPQAGTIGGEVVYFATMFNLALALLHLLPGLPLDGGRMLRAAIWFGADYSSGTRIATYTGYAIVAGMLFVGVRDVLEPATAVHGVGYLLLAWLLYEAGATLRRRRVVGTLFERLTARDVLQDAPRTYTPDTVLREIARAWRTQTGEQATPVVQNGALLGLLTRSRVEHIPQGYWDERTAADAMIPVAELPLYTPDDPLVRVVATIDDNVYDALPLMVVDNGQFVGMIEPRELEPLLAVYDVHGLSSATATAAAQHATNDLRQRLQRPSAVN
jgi:Zn-dependent protease/CBS domain-containing protein